MRKLLTGCLLICYVLFSTGALHAQENAFAIHNADNPPPFGLYESAEAYLNLQPTDTGVIFLHIPQQEGDGINTCYRRKPDGKKGEVIQPENAFAVSDGKTFYVAYLGKWRRTKKIDNDYYFLGPLANAHSRKSQHYHILLGSRAGFGANSMMDVTEMTESNTMYKMRYDVLEKRWIPVEKARFLK